MRFFRENRLDIEKTRKNPQKRLQNGKNKHFERTHSLYSMYSKSIKDDDAYY